VGDNIDPILRPPRQPAGFETIELAAPTPSKPDSHLFFVEYFGPEKELWITAGPTNPPPPGPGGHQEEVTVRGQDAVLTVHEDTDPSEGVWLWWYEPSSTATGMGDASSARVQYALYGEGMTPEDVLDAAESLEAWNP
jgi:hypothetical protein